MFLRIAELELHKLPIDAQYSFQQLAFEEAGVSLAAPLRVIAEAQLHALTRELRVRGRLEGSITCECDRCLAEFELPASGPFDLVYEPVGVSTDDDDLALSENDAGVGYYEKEGLDLADVVRERLYLLLPMSRVCQPDCKGICPECGANRNEVACGCAARKVDERWAALKESLNRN
jgi:uncharacterized metal-binding protein YceD (DUF177 family)